MLWSRFSLIFNTTKYVIIFLLTIMLQSCTNYEIGKELVESFDSPPQELDEDSNKIKKKQLDSRTKASRKKLSNDKQVKISQPVKKVKSNIRNKRTKNIPFNPQPYRITIKLSGANPSAPAEGVTDALRNAGVKFEVEKIERITEKESIRILDSQRLRR